MKILATWHLLMSRIYFNTHPSPPLLHDTNRSCVHHLLWNSGESLRNNGAKRWKVLLWISNSTALFSLICFGVFLEHRWFSAFPIKYEHGHRCSRTALGAMGHALPDTLAHDAVHRPESLLPRSGKKYKIRD